jgi:hypothetical protein
VPTQTTTTTSAQVSVTNAATALDQNTAGARSLLVRNRGSVAVYVGGAAVTTSTGFQLDPGESATADFPTFGGGLWGITASSTARVDVLEVGRQ